MTIMTTEIVPNMVINERTQPTDGFLVHIREDGNPAILETFEYDQSWTIEDACQDALSGV